MTLTYWGSLGWIIFSEKMVMDYWRIVNIIMLLIASLEKYIPHEFEDRHLLIELDLDLFATNFLR